MVEPRAIAETFLRRLSGDEPGDPAELLADDVVITRPGASFEGTDAFERFRAGSGERYQTVAKSFDRWIVTDAHVVSTGTLYGVDADGEEFEEVRYVDVFEIEDGEIVRLDVWNDALVDGVVSD